ncbi:hypothetical protein L7F22_006972 [Adiantum nelumboides]|nr:hypothetical protein [Adiantum nelumboides]
MKRLSDPDINRELNLSRTRSKEEKNLAQLPSKSNKGSPDENSRKSLSSTSACRAKNSSSAKKLVAENPLLFSHVTREQGMREGEMILARVTQVKAFLFDGFCDELEEVLLKQQEAEVNSKEQLDAETIWKRKFDVETIASLPDNSSEALISIALSGNKVASLLEVADEREKGELEPDDEAFEKILFGGEKEVENVKRFEMHIERISQDCSDSNTNKSCKNQSHSKSSRPDSTLSAAKFERQEEERRQDCDGLENQKGCKVAFGCLSLHTEPSRHCINSESSKDAGEVVKSRTISILGVVINSIGISVEKQKNIIDEFCQDVWDAHSTSYPLRHFSVHKGSVMFLDFHPNNEDLLYSSDGENEVKYWSVVECFREERAKNTLHLLANDVLHKGVQGIFDIVTILELMNLDFADVKAVMLNSGTAMLGVGGKDLTLQEVNKISQVVTSLAVPSANIIFGAVVDERYDGPIHVTIMATGFSHEFQKSLIDPKAAKVEAEGEKKTNST